MKCPFCGEETKVVDSRSYMEGYVIKRRRECINCHKRYNTYEKVDEDLTIYVIKKDKRREKFDTEKLLHGLMNATIKRNISREQLDMLILDIQKTIHTSLQWEITSEELGEMVLDRLKKLDQVAYIRFVSVYKSFTDIQSFLDLIEKIKLEKNISSIDKKINEEEN